MDGTYKIILYTTMGNEEGILEIRRNGNKVSGVIIARKSKNYFSDGEVTGNSISFSGKLKISIMSFNYNAKCTITDSNIVGVVKTKYGDFKVEGKKI